MTVTDQFAVELALGEILAPFDRIYAALEESARAVLSLESAAGAGDRQLLRRSDVASLRDLFHRHLLEHAPLVAGTGVVFAPNVLQDSDRWLEWYWRAEPGADLTFLAVGLDPAREDHYDYERATWFQTPQRTRARSIVGPHVDHGATRQHLMTPGLPIFTEDERFVGVAAADLRVSEIEPIVLNALRRLGSEAALVNANGRVIASNTSQWRSGSLAWRRSDPSPLAAEKSTTSTYGATTVVPCAGYPWALLLVP